MDWTRTRTLVTGGASFIGSHLVAKLVERGAHVSVVDDLSSGRLEYLEDLISAGTVTFKEADLRREEEIRSAVTGVDVVFHLAADHGGRGYVDLHQAACAANIALDGVLFRLCRDAAVRKVVYASSGCVYPSYLQQDPKKVLYLTEDMVGPPYDADNMYGWAKLMGEMTLQAYVRDYGIRAASCRYFTVYGERGKEDHAVIAMIARAFVKQNPFEVWGNGEQIRNWTHVDDIVEGTILAAEHIDDGSAINLGTTERTRVIDAVREVMRYTELDSEVQLRPDMPVGPLNRVADNTLAYELMGWKPKVPFLEGLRRTIDWYYAAKSRDHVSERLELSLVER